MDAERSGFGLLNRANGIDRLKAHYVAECSKHDDLDTRVSFVPKRGSVKDTLMSTVSDLKADMVILGSMQLSKFKPGGLVIGSPASNISHTPLMLTHAASALPTQVIGSLASAVAKAAPAHVTVVKNYMVA